LWSTYHLSRPAPDTSETQEPVIFNRLVVYATADDRIWAVLKSAKNLDSAKEQIRDVLVANCDAALSTDQRNTLGSSHEFFSEKLGLTMNGAN
jgi:hypothetical protein